MAEKEHDRKTAETGETEVGKNSTLTEGSGHDKPDNPYTDELLEKAMSKNRVALEILKDR